jgi:hypothetical protein
MTAQDQGSKSSSKGRGFLLALIVLLFLSFITWRIIQIARAENEHYPQYTYRRTRQLVQTVTEAKKLLEAKGPEAFATLDRMKSEQLDVYLYVYRASDAMCLYHGETPAQVGTSLIDFRDQLDKPMHRLVTAAIADPLNVHGWVHYYWHRSHDMFLDWKSSCNLAATFPDGTKVYVGGGIYGIGAEIEFARIEVSDAARLLKAEGEPALEKLMSPSGPYFFHGNSVFVLRTDGTTIIDPVLKGRVKRDLDSFVDSMGHSPFTNLLKRLETQRSAQVPVYAISPSSMNPIKKIIYAERSTMAGEPVVVGTIIESPHSVWLR